jgi:hypothetical protein
VRTEHFQAKLAEIRAILEERFDTRPMDERSIGFDYAAGPILLPCYCELNPDMRGFIFRGIFALRFPPEHRAVAAEYIHRVNYSLPIGNWAIDLDSGDVRWKLGVYFGDGELTPILIREVLESSFHFIDQYVFGLVKLHNGKSLADALASIGEDHGVGTIPRKSREA